MDEIINKTIQKIVKLNITFSHPRFAVGTAFIDLDSVSPFDWRKIKVAKIKDKII